MFLRFCLFLLFLSPAAHALLWQVDSDQSHIRITAQVYDGEPFVAEFTRWQAEIIFDPADLSTAQIRATIETASFTALNDQDAIWASDATGADWLFSDAFPTAQFQSTGVEGLGGGNTAFMAA